MPLHIEATVDGAGRIILEHLPFRPGDRVDIVISADLRNSVLRYDNPFDPVAPEDWEYQP